MAKKIVKPKKVGGPFVTAALFCEGVNEEANGVVSAIRIVDEIRMGLSSNAPPDFPSKAHPLELSMLSLIIIRAGDLAGKKKRMLKIVINAPSGKKVQAIPHVFDMPPYPNGTATIKAKINLKATEAGCYWLDVFVDGKRLTKMALNLQIQPAVPPASVPAGGAK